ncbi:DUF1638 domain-containing protein [Selenihalanaerobacter shriftii]|uniref:DUF1638 domain-containing protein n=1 Tax=Selenihalanaerobacter shriftii TaxID=142842 RepID=A0A1T4NXA5_9FIRM|nr:DUF1638 domain-containing protein [Selenihalanaerobacter shriftii]SJZ83863.1 Protein of unknown function [Selenihalanaerobacter shriftii]
MNQETALVACGILKEELETICQSEDIRLSRYYIDPALHVDLDRLEERLVQVLEKVAQKHKEVLVIFGSCHPDIDEIITEFGGERLAIKDCIGALHGDKRQQLDRKANNFYLTSGWLNNWRKIFVKGLGWDEIDGRQNFGFYDRILLVDTKVREISDEEILEFFEYAQVAIKPFPTDLNYFKNLILNKLG